MYIAVNRITAPKEAMDRMTEGFRRNGASLKEFPGFLSFELWRGDATIEAVSKWESQQAYEAWRNSDNFLAAHSSPRTGGSGGSTSAFYEGEVIAER